MVRIKHRYILMNVLYPDEEPSSRLSRSSVQNEVPWTIRFRSPSSDEFNAKILLRMIRDGVSELFGDYGAGMVSASLQIKYLSPATSTAIIRVSRAHYQLVWAALSFVTRIPKPVDRVCVIQVVRVSGTIKKSEEEAIRRARIVILRAKTPARSQSGARSPGLEGSGRVEENLRTQNEDPLRLVTDVDDPMSTSGEDDDD